MYILPVQTLSLHRTGDTNGALVLERASIRQRHLRLHLTAVPWAELNWQGLSSSGAPVVTVITAIRCADQWLWTCAHTTGDHPWQFGVHQLLDAQYSPSQAGALALRDLGLAYAPEQLSPVAWLQLKGQATLLLSAPCAHQPLELTGPGAAAWQATPPPLIDPESLAAHAVATQQLTGAGVSR